MYPDAGGFALRRALAGKYQVELAQVALGNGSNDLVYQLVLATCEPTDEVLTHRYAFMSYRLAAQVAGRSFVETPTTPDLACDEAALIAAITPRTKLVVLGTPNNPTGSIVSSAAAARILDALPARALLVMDEARTSSTRRAGRRSITPTGWRCSAAIRASSCCARSRRRTGSPGCASASRWPIRPWSMSSAASGGRSTSGASPSSPRSRRSRTTSTWRGAPASRARRRAVPAGGARARRARVPSLANFVLIDCGRPSTPIYDRLLRRGVIVRPLAAWGLPTHLRVSVARVADMPRVIAARRTRR